MKITTTLHSVPVWSLLPTPPKSPTPAGHPTSPLSPDTVPRVKDSVLPKCPLPPPRPPPLGTPLTSPVFTCADGLAENQFPKTASSAEIHLLRQLTELREMFSLPEPSFQGCNAGTARWKRCTGQGVGIGYPFHALSRKLSSPQTPGSPTPQAEQKPRPGWSWAT